MKITIANPLSVYIINIYSKWIRRCTLSEIFLPVPDPEVGVSVVDPVRTSITRDAYSNQVLQCELYTHK